MTLVELLVAMTIFGVVISLALSFMAQQNAALQLSVERMSALKNAHYAVTTLARDLGAVRTGLPSHQTSLVHGDDDVAVFSAYDGADVDPADADPADEAGVGVANRPGMLTFYLLADSVTDREDDFVLYRQVSGGAPEVVARHLLRDGKTPFFAFEREIGGTSAPADIVRVTLVATNGLRGEHERSVRIERRIALPDPGQGVL